MTARTSSRHRSEGFTLPEVSIAMVVIALGILSLLHAMASGTRVNAHGRDLTQGMFLAQEIREWTLRVPFGDLGDLKDVTYDPPRDGANDVISDMAGWSQTMTVAWVNPHNLLATVADGASDVVRVTTRVDHDGTEVARASWLVFRREGE